jgi:hypothetical protein
MTKLLFLGANVSMVVNEKASKGFSIKRDAWQGCQNLLLIIRVSVQCHGLKTAYCQENLKVPTPKIWRVTFDNPTCKWYKLYDKASHVSFYQGSSTSSITILPSLNLFGKECKSVAFWLRMMQGSRPY